MRLLWSAAPSPGPVDPDRVQPGLLGLTFVVLLALAVVALYFSLRRHLGRIDVGRHERERRGGGEPAEPSES